MEMKNLTQTHTRTVTSITGRKEERGKGEKEGGKNHLISYVPILHIKSP